MFGGGESLASHIGILGKPDYPGSIHNFEYCTGKSS